MLSYSCCDVDGGKGRGVGRRAGRNVVFCSREKEETDISVWDR